jgi:protein O-GlcNAc transferase
MFTTVSRALVPELLIPREMIPVSTLEGGALDLSSVQPGADSDAATLENERMRIVSEVRAALYDYQANPGDDKTIQKLTSAMREASAMISRLPRKEPYSATAEDARQLVREVWASGVHDRRVDPQDLAKAEALGAKSWPGLLAAMLLTPAWQWKNAPLLISVPDLLRADYTKWLFTAPQGFAEVGDAEIYAAYTALRLEELVRWVNRSPGVNAETEVLAAYATTSSVIPLYFTRSSLRRHAELRGRLLTRAFVLPDDHFDDAVVPREGRRLRVGFVNRHFGSQTETYTTLPTFEHLDPERFEVILFAHQSRQTPLEEHCRAHASDFFLLPDDIEGQVAMLRSATLDIIVFGTNLTAIFNEVTRIALHRVAPLQVANNSSCITSGLTHVDLYVSGTLTETSESPSHFTERLGLLPGPAHAFNYSADREDPQVECSRAEFGLPDDALVFVSAANYYKVTPEMQHAWAELLAAVPGACLLLHPFNPNWTSEYPIARFRADFERVLASHGVEASRLAVSTMSFPSRTDVKTLLSLGNIYLDTFPFAGVNSLIDPLELGLPVVAWEGNTFRSRMGAALLRELKLPDLIATSSSEYQTLARTLATDSVVRESTASRIRAKMEHAPVFLDSLAASEAMGDLLETAYDELVKVGRTKFRSDALPLRVNVDATAVDSAADPVTAAKATLRRSPADPAARHLIGRDLLDAGRTPRAVTYLLGALQGEEAKAELWLDVARALKADGQLGEALQALEAGLKLDQSMLEGWVLFAQLADAVGSVEIAREAAGVVRQMAPHDDRVSAFV